METFSFDRHTGALTGASIRERLAALTFAAGARASAPMHWRGFSVGCRAIRTMLEPREIVLQLNDDAKFAFPFGDGYWSLLLDRGFVYEGEVESFLRRIADIDYCFIDGGANFGYWSVLVSSEPFGSHPVIAIEPSSTNVFRLRRNAAINGSRIKIVERAIAATNGKMVRLEGTKHEAFRVADEIGTKLETAETVETVALDALLDDVRPGQALVVNLDIEGMEIDAIKGGQRILEHETVLIVEDHGADRSHAISRYLMEEADCNLFVVDKVSGGYRALTDISALDAIKKSTAFGYNIIATRSTRWHERITSLCVS